MQISEFAKNLQKKIIEKKWVFEKARWNGKISKD